MLTCFVKVNFLKKFVACVLTGIFLSLLWVLSAQKIQAQSLCSGSDEPTTSNYTVCCPGGSPCVTKYHGGAYCLCDSFYCSDAFSGCLQQKWCETCADDSQVCIDFYDTFLDKGPVTCDAETTCCCKTSHLGFCPSPGDTNGQAELRNLVCPASCTPGQNFNITYEYRAVNYSGQVDVWRKVMAYGHPPYLGSLQWHTTGDPETSCKVSSLTSPSNWQTATQPINCAELWEGYNTNPNIVVYGYNRDYGASGFVSWCDNNFPSSDSMLSCQIKKTIVSFGYIKAYHPTKGVIKLNLISVADGLAKSPFPGMVKVARFNGDVNTAADLVATTDPSASPVRIRMPDGSIKSWKMIP